MGGEKEPRARSAGVEGGAAEICANCPRPGKKRCAACTIPWYCSKECQREHWKKAHRFECKVLQQQRDGSVGDGQSYLQTFCGRLPMKLIVEVLCRVS